MTNYKIKITKSINWDCISQISAIIAGSRGSGKTYLLLSLIAQMGSMPALPGKLIGLGTSPTQFFLIDIKNDLAQIAPLLPDGRVGNDADSALEVMRTFNSLMKKRLKWLRDHPQHFITAKSMGLVPYYLIIDEFSSLNMAFSGISKDEKAKKFEFNRLLKEIVLLGRSAGFGLIISSQQISVENSGIGTDLQQNVGLRVHMGMATETAYRQTFGNDFELPQGLYLEPAQGLIWLDDPLIGNQVRSFASPWISGDFWQILETALKNQDSDYYLFNQFI